MVASRTLAAHAVRLGYDGHVVVPELSVTIPTAQVTVIVGANGSGKSTLLRALARLIRPEAGTVTLDGVDIHSLPTKALAQTIGLLPQQPIAPDGVTVMDLVGRGRHPHQQWFRSHSTEDDRIVADSLRATETLDLADRHVDELSGGQRQRVWIAMALAQQTEILLLDEPTTFLDVSHQLDVLDLLAELNRERGCAVVMVLHDLNLAARYADHLIVLGEGRILAEGAPATVLTQELALEAFGLDAVIIDDPISGTPMVIPRSRQHR